MPDQDSERASTKASESSRSFSAWLRDMPRWKKIALGAALGTAAVAGIWNLVSGDPAPAESANGASSNLSASLIENTPNQQGQADTQATEEPTSKGFFRLGFSFVAGFCIGAVLRTVLKLAAIAFGFWLLLTFLLSYGGVLTIEWEHVDAMWNRFMANIEQEWGNFQSFMLGSLPATGLAVTGLAVGFKRH